MTNRAEYEALVYAHGKAKADYIISQRKENIKAAKAREEEKKRQQAKEQAERDHAQTLLRQATAKGAHRARRVFLEQYCSDVRDPQTRAELIAVLEETRVEFLEDQQ